MLPVVAGAVVGWFVGRASAAGWSRRRTAGAVCWAAVLCAGTVAVLAVPAGGPLGVGTLARFGPVWWQVGGAVVGWIAGVGLPVALAVRAWRDRSRGGPRQWAPVPTLSPRKATGGAETAPGTAPETSSPGTAPGAAPGTAPVADPVEPSGPQDDNYDQDDTYARHDEDDTYEPYDFLPAAPQTGPVPSPTPWSDDPSHESRWAVLKEASAPPEENPEKPPPTD